MMRTARISVFPLLLLATVAAAEDPKAPPPLWSGKAEMSYVATSGNTDTQSIGAAAEAEYQPGVWSGKARAEFIRSEANGLENARALSFILRGARKLKNPRLETYVLAGYLKNTFAGIDRRLAGEGGLAYEILPAGVHSLKGEAGLGYTKEDRVPKTSRSFATGRLGLLYKWKFSKSADFSNELSYTENLKDSHDWRFADRAAVSASMTSLLSLKVSWAITKLNEPPTGFKKTDTITSAAVVAKF